jgi:hypothetical protein
MDVLLGDGHELSDNGFRATRTASLLESASGVWERLGTPHGIDEVLEISIAELDRDRERQGRNSGRKRRKRLAMRGGRHQCGFGIRDSGKNTPRRLGVRRDDEL